jgi:hypothetical protein
VLKNSGRTPARRPPQRAGERRRAPERGARAHSVTERPPSRRRPQRAEDSARTRSERAFDECAAKAEAAGPRHGCTLERPGPGENTYDPSSPLRPSLSLRTHCHKMPILSSLCTSISAGGTPSSGRGGAPTRESVDRFGWTMVPSTHRVGSHPLGQDPC